MPEQIEKPEKKAREGKTVALSLRLAPVNNSDQPVSANHITVSVAQGIAYLDFGFIEPALLAGLARTAREGKTMPEKLEGKLVVRVGIPGLRAAGQTGDSWLFEIGAGMDWHHTVQSLLEAGFGGLENLALIPGSVGAAPIQNTTLLRLMIACRAGPAAGSQGRRAASQTKWPAPRRHRPCSAQSIRRRQG